MLLIKKKLNNPWNKMMKSGRIELVKRSALPERAQKVKTSLVTAIGKKKSVYHEMVKQWIYRSFKVYAQKKKRDGKQPLPSIRYINCILAYTRGFSSWILYKIRSGIRAATFLSSHAFSLPLKLSSIARRKKKKRREAPRWLQGVHVVESEISLEEVSREWEREREGIP